MTTDTTAKTIDFTDYPKQARFVGTSAHFAAFIAGINAGKTMAGSVRGLMMSQGFVGTNHILRTPNLGIVTAPTYSMLRDITVRTFIEWGEDLIRSFNKSEMHMVLKNGSEILFRSTDEPERLRGFNATWAMMDEAALSPQSAFDILIGRIRQFGKLGYLWPVTTPKGRNWLYKTFVQQERKGYKWFHATSRDNPHTDQAIFDAWDEAYVGDFARQELGGEFVAFEGLIYSEFDRPLHITTQKQPGFKQVVAGVDWGYTNPGVILVGGLDYDSRLWIIHEEYQRQKHIDDWTLTAKELQKTYNITSFHCDPSKPDYISQFTNAGLYAEGADNTVTTGIQAVKRRLVRQGDGQPRLYLAPSAVHLATEFEQYQWRPSKDQAFMDEPMKSNDHAVDALRYMVMALDDRQQVSLSIKGKRVA